MLHHDESHRWHLITGEYPPATGGVADYTAHLAAGLAEAGIAVDVWCPGDSDGTPARPGVDVHPFPDGFRPSGLKNLATALNRFPGPRTLLVQYVPNAFGLRGCNLPFCLWLIWRRFWHGDDVRVMFHEPYFYFGRQSIRRNLLAVITRVMAWLLLLASRHVYVSAPAWKNLLRPWFWPGRIPMTWLPIPATIVPRQDPRRVALLKKRLTSASPDALLLGHFGTYYSLMTPILRETLTQVLLRNPHVHLCLLGAGSDRFAQELLDHNPGWLTRIHALGRLEADEVSCHLQALDLIVQPYPDGVSSRRTSVMSALIHGVPTVTTSGPFTEAIWHQEPAAVLAPAGNRARLIEAVESLLADRTRRLELGVAGREFYELHFALAHTMAILGLKVAESRSKLDQSLQSECEVGNLLEGIR